MAGEGLLVSQLVNSSAHSSAEHDGSWVKSCLCRGTSHILGSCGAVTAQTEQSSGYKTLWNGLGIPLWDGRELGCASALGSELSPGLSFGSWGAVVENP